MARTQPQEIKLPWRSTVDGAVAELGAIFRVEIVGGDWQCSVKSGRCRTVIAKGLKTQGEGKRRAQAHAATMQEVRKAVDHGAADAEPGAKKTAASRRPRKTRAESQEKTVAAAEPVSAPPPPAPAPPPAPPSPAITFQETEDGCLCGKTGGVCWVANAEEVALARPLPQEVMDQIRDAVAQHYAAQRSARQSAATNARSEKPSRTTAKKASKSDARKTAKAQPKPAKEPKPAAKTKPAKEPKPAPEPKPAKEPRSRKAGRGRMSKPKTAKGKRGEAKEDSPVNGKEAPPAAAKRVTRQAAAAKPSAPAIGDAEGMQPAKAKRTSKRAAPSAAASSAPTGPIAWSEVEGKPRGVATHGTFLIEPEGQGFGLYFADSSGQSRHLRTGTMPELRRAAEEFAARGEPAPLRDAPSREQDEALMRIFASGAVGG